MAVEPQELNDVFQSHNWPTKQTSLRDNEQEAEQMESEANLQVICFLSCMILVGAVGLSTASQQETEFSSEREAQNGCGQERVHNGHSSAAVATKSVVVAAAKKQRGKMGVGPEGPGDEDGEECKRKVSIGKIV